MSHETVIYGFIEGATWRANSYRLLQERNLVTLSALPAEDSWPPLARSMFSSPDDKPLSGTHRAQIITLGASMKNVEFGELGDWTEKLEPLLKRLHWFRATVHMLTEVMGDFRLEYEVSARILESYSTDQPQPTDEWVRTAFHNDAELSDPEIAKLSRC